MTRDGHRGDGRSVRLRGDGGAPATHRASSSPTLPSPSMLKPYYRYGCKRPCFHDEYLVAFNNPNVTLVDCPAGVTRITPHGVVANGEEYEVDCIVYATGFEAELTPFARRAGHTIIGRDGITMEEKWKDGVLSLHGMTTHGFPNMFIMPAPGQQAVDHAQLHAPDGRRRRARRRDDRRCSRRAGVKVFETTAEAEQAWTDIILSTWRDNSAFMAACTPSRTQLRGQPHHAEPAQRRLRRWVRRLLRVPGPPRRVASQRRLRRVRARRAQPDRGRDGSRRPRRRRHRWRGRHRRRDRRGARAPGRVRRHRRSRGRGRRHARRAATPRTPPRSGSSTPAAQARASNISVTDEDAVRALFAELVDEFGALDAVVNVAGISRPTGFAAGDRGRLARGARRAPRRLPQRAPRRAADHGRGRTRPDPRGHVGLGVAPRRRRRVQLRQARGRRAHVAASGRRRRRASP